MSTLLISCFLFAFASLSAQENTALLCTDGLDNDGDGLVDCDDPQCFSFPGNGCSICSFDGSSFADTVLYYEPQCTDVPAIMESDPQAALGLTDFSNGFEHFVSLGENGVLILGFLDNVIANSGDDNSDLWIFEIGIVESSKVELRPFDQSTRNATISSGLQDSDGDGFFDFGTIGGATASIDIDAYITGLEEKELKYDAIKLTDIIDDGCIDFTNPGADINAVCAISSCPIDCNNNADGSAIRDLCGECLEEDDPNFNQSCLDCAGVINGLAIVDDCGECLEPSDSLFNQSCVLSDQIFVPNVFSPNNDGLNDEFQIFKRAQLNAKIVRYTIFSRLGELLFESNNFEFNATDKWWNGIYKGQAAPPGIYLYLIEVEYTTGTIGQFKGDFTIVL